MSLGQRHPMRRHEQATWLNSRKSKPLASVAPHESLNSPASPLSTEHRGTKERRANEEPARLPSLGLESATPGGGAVDSPYGYLPRGNQPRKIPRTAPRGSVPILVR